MHRPDGRMLATYVDFFPELNSVCEAGFRAVKEVTIAQRLDDPFAVFEAPTDSETVAEPDAGELVPTADEIWAKIQSTREQIRHPGATINPNRIAADACNDYATIGRLLGKRGIAAPPMPDHRLHPQQTTNYVLQKLDDAELALNRAVAASGETTSSDSAAAIKQSGRDARDFMGRLLADPDAPHAQPVHPLAPAETAMQTEPKPSAARATRRKRPGRPKAGGETTQHEARLAAEWKRARDAGVYKADFAKEHNTSLADFDRLLDRVSKRKPTSE